MNQSALLTGENVRYQWEMDGCGQIGWALLRDNQEVIGFHSRIGWLYVKSDEAGGLLKWNDKQTWMWTQKRV